MKVFVLLCMCMTCMAACPGCPTTSNTLTMTVGYTSSGSNMGIFSVEMFKGQNPSMSNDFRDMAIGTEPPRTSDSRHSSSSSGFKGMSTLEVFPQFDGCDGGPTQAKSSMSSPPSGKPPIMGKNFTGESYQMPTVPPGYGLLTMLPDGAYVFRTPNDNMSNTPGYMDIGSVDQSSMKMIKRINRVVCNNAPLGDTCAPTMSPVKRHAERVKRQNSGTSITDITMK